MLIIKSIIQQHQLLNMPEPRHPLVSIIRFEDAKAIATEDTVDFRNKFYNISLKKTCSSNEKYGRNDYDFNHGFMIFCAPDRKMVWDVNDRMPAAGWNLSIHPDFLIGYQLWEKIKHCDFFIYGMTEALHLSLSEEAIIENILNGINQEYHASIDVYSQDVIISQIETLINYALRFYTRQFITRKHINNELLHKTESILNLYFNSNQIRADGLPTVKYLADQLNLSPSYLSDLLRNLTGQNAQQHIHNKLIEKAKELLVNTSLPVNEIAYQLGFEYPQSFNRLFKQKTELSPYQFKSSLN
ncbi:helix-turn-helix domain-containing protein [Mucilaginibacter sp. UYCu711]|uniref:helix-turn-helix domain-containing protein n=1 Tax=Mucilaginibacter sp. UYCu711 TaxID=3156339 RepID=UPI003D1BC17F